jgi:hypothetical protein
MTRLTIGQANQISSLTATPNTLYQKFNIPIKPFTSLIPTHLPLKNPLTGQPNPPRIDGRASSSGDLIALPFELQRRILMFCDFGTLAALRLVNYHFYSAIQGVKEYVELTTHYWDDVSRHASGTLRVMGDVDVLKYHSLKDVYRVFTSSECVWCGEFTPFVFLLHFERACFSCLKRDVRARMVDEVMVRKVWGIDSERLAKEGLRSVWSLKAQNGYVYRDERVECAFENRVRLYLASDVEDMALRVHGSMEGIRRTIKKQFEMEVRNYELVMEAEKERDEKWNPKKKPENPLWALEPESMPDYDDEDATRFCRNLLDQYRCMTATAMPILNKDVMAWPRVESGVWCKGCCRSYNRWMEMERWPLERDSGWRAGWTPQLKDLERAMLKSWSQEAFLFEHFPECAATQAYWASISTRVMGVGVGHPAALITTQ